MTTTPTYGSRIVDEDMRGIVQNVASAAATFRDARILVTGSNGYLARYLVTALLALKDSQHALGLSLVLVQRSTPPATDPYSRLLARDDVELHLQDVCDPIAVDGAVDIIVHAASKASPRAYLADPIGTIDVNTGATRSLLNLGLNKVARRFLYFSSGEIYGNAPPEAVPTPETFPGLVDCIGPRSVYTESKRMGESIVMAFHRAHGLNVQIVRPFHIYGPGMRLDDGRVIADFLQCRLYGDPITILSAGLDTRAFCYIADATALTLQVLATGSPGGVYNVGNDGEQTSIRDVAELIAQLDEPTVPVRVSADLDAAHLQGTPNQVCPDMSRCRQKFGYAPAVGLKAGLQRTLAWYRENRCGGSGVRRIPA
jgi:UDP-glucuronate decarboxylase